MDAPGFGVFVSPIVYVCDMITIFLWFIALVALTLVTMMLSNKLRIAYPIGLVIVGLVVCLIPETPRISLDPELIFIVFLPPLLYESGWAVSWKELWKWRRIIGSFAFLVVFLSAAAVAYAANMLLPGFSLALGFLLGGVVSSPDAVSTAAILRFVKVPKRLASILEGESLLNDASSLIIFRFAAVAVTTGQFVLWQASLQFTWMVIGGVAIGVFFGYIARFLHRRLPTDANTDIILTLLTPYLMYICAELLEASGVIATVIGGLYMAARSRETFSAATRVRAVHVWDSLVFILNGLTFILVGLELPEILEGMRAEGVDVTTATLYGLGITAVLIVVRFLAVLGAIATTQVMKHVITVADDRIPSWRMPVVFGWAGMRGAVSLAAALSIPLMAGDAPFPHRNLIIYITFVVIFVTLVFQGLTLPALIRMVKLEDPGDYLPEEEADALIAGELARRSIAYVEAHYPEVLQQDERLQGLAAQWRLTLAAGTEHKSSCQLEIYLDILEEQRRVLAELNKRPEISEELVRSYARQIDLEEAKWV